MHLSLQIILKARQEFGCGYQTNIKRALGETLMIKVNWLDLHIGEKPTGNQIIMEGLNTMECYILKYGEFRMKPNHGMMFPITASITLFANLHRRTEKILRSKIMKLSADLDPVCV